jgi:hypothetical protein
VNIGFAAFTMNKAIDLSPTAYGLGGGLFFIGYFLFEVPSNLILYRVGVRVRIARVMVTWGILSACSAFVTGPHRPTRDRVDQGEDRQQYGWVVRGGFHAGAVGSVDVATQPEACRNAAMNTYDETS